MHFAICREELVPLTNKLANIVSLKPHIPILNNILIEAKDNDEIIISGTDLVVSMKLFARAKVLKSGTVSLHAKRFAQLIREITIANVEIICDDNNMKILANSSSFMLPIVNAKDFPPFPDLVDSVRATVNGKVFKEMVYRGTYATTSNDDQFALFGVLLEIENDTLRFVTADGKRLAKAETSVEVSESVDHRVLVPLKGLQEVSSLISNDDNISIHITEGKIGFHAKQGMLVAKLLVGKFPNYRQMIPKNADINVSVHREELMTLLRQIALFTNEDSQSACFMFEEGLLSLKINNAVGYGNVSMTIEYSGKPFSIAFNPTDFLDILKYSKDEVVNVHLTNPHFPALLTDSSQAQAVIMPMKIFCNDDDLIPAKSYC